MISRKTVSIKVKQHDITDCGAACLASVASHYKLEMSVARIRQIAGTDTKGTNVLGMIKAAEQLRFSAKGVRGNQDSLGKIPMPTIAHVVVERNKVQLHHYVVLYKYNEKQLTYMDPADGEMHTMSIEEFMKLWTGVLVLLMPNDDFVAKNEKVSNFKRFVFLLAPHKGVLVQSLIGAILYTLLGLSTSIYIQKITDNVLTTGNTNLLNLLSVSMLIMVVFQILLGIYQTLFMLKTGQKIDTRLILGYYKHLLKLPQRFFDTMRVGEIISRINDAVKIRAFINDVSISLTVNVFVVLFSFALMFIYSWKLASIMLIVVPLYSVVYFVTNKLNKKQERKLMEHSAELESQLVESLNSVRTIKQFGIEEFSNMKTEVRFIGLLKIVFKSGENSMFSTYSSEVISRVFTIILLWSGSYFVIDNEITPGELLSFYAIIGYFMGPISGLIGANKSIQNALIAADRLFEIMDLEREATDSKVELKREDIGDIKFENIKFAYGTRKEVFQNFSFTIPKGKLTAVIGESGSGKTTLASLLQKLYTLNAGKITVNDLDVNNFSCDSLRSMVSIVPQQLSLFSGNIIDNIAIGDLQPDMERIVSIVQQLGLMSFVEKLPNGFTTQIGENGTSLSGGEKQRLAIARAMYKNPEIFIFDEATSSLDSDSEQYVKSVIQTLKNQGKTILLIAHRLSTVIDADKIAILENGILIEEGTHVSLFKEGTRYYTMWQKQMPDFQLLK
ncbi:MAG: peptidase domain-containing ABC transporter [Bacteroidales bacterium]|nr:peptidase domain-containing ABC transporter [Bacteroidales bacterium]